MSVGNFNQRQETAPQVSFAMACYNAQPYLRSAIETALSQTDVSVEVLVVDDGSSDTSLAEARAMSAEDPRVKVFQTPQNGGPSAARNLALEKMRGEWFAILDSDDLIDPTRSSTMIKAAEKNGADLIADNLMVFGQSVKEEPFFSATEFGNGRFLGIDEYFSRSALFAKSPGPGFLKPMIRKSLFERLNIRYNEALRIGEDDELIVRLLNAGCSYYLLPETSYRYRKHSQSISHRLSLENARKMVNAENAIQEEIGPERAQSRAYRRRYNALMRGFAFVRSVEEIKKRRFMAAFQTLLKQPSAIPLYRMPLTGAVKKLLGSK